MGPAVVFAVVALAGLSFALRWLPVEVTAIAVAVTLALLSPWTGVGPEEAISGFASPATVTVLAMFILSEGLRRTGVVDRIASLLLRITGDSERRRLAATVGTGGLLAGFVNNTPLVAVLVPALVELSGRTRSSPSRLLLPLSYAAMLGGTLTVISTSANLLASDLSARLLNHPLSIFEITPLGVLVLAVGAAYLLAFAPRLVPERIAPATDLTQRYEMRPYLHRLMVPPGSPLVGREIRETDTEGSLDLDLLRIRRGRRSYFGLTTDRELQAGDVIIVRAEVEVFDRFVDRWEARRGAEQEITDASLVDSDHALVEVTVRPGSDLAGQSLVTSRFRERFRGTVLAIRRGDEVERGAIERRQLREGDSLLVLTLRQQLPTVSESPELSVTGHSPASPDAERPPAREGPVSRTGREGLVNPAHWEGPPGTTGEAGGAGGAGLRTRRMPVAVAILLAVVGVAAAGLLPIYIAALAGVVAMVATGCLRMPEAYEAVDWKVIFLLAGVIPLGIAMARSGAAGVVASVIVEATAELPPVAALTLFYLATALLANVVSSLATLVLMIPVAVDAAGALGADPLSYLLAVTFAANAAFLSPVGYQTNLMVLTPGGYRFRDYVRVGAPLQLLLAAVTPLAIAALWGL